MNNKYEVVYTVNYRAIIELEPGQLLQDAICDIDISENDTSSYVESSFDCLHVSQDDEEVKDTKGIYGMADSDIA